MRFLCIVFIIISIVLWCYYVKEPLDVSIPTFYQFCDFQGTSFNLTTGSYNGMKLSKLYKKYISSIKIPHGWKVILYENDDFTGRSLEVIKDTECLIDKGFNDVTSSIVVVRTR